jgi:iron complex outermembrane receptor protein
MKKIHFFLGMFLTGLAFNAQGQGLKDTILDEVSVVGSRFLPRTAMNSPVPIDNLKMKDLATSGQFSLDKMMHYRLPSFNSTQQTISDATAHFDPADLRGLGPSRTLILVNGKRKNASSLVYINDTPGKGEVGVDMKSIPVAAIERIEVLRDGASAQYGSDAIAGVINIILKKDVDMTSGNAYTSVTQQGDGLIQGFQMSTGTKVGSTGNLTVSMSYEDQNETNRAGQPGQDYLFGVNNAWTQANPGLGMRVGLPNMTSNSVFYNYSNEINEDMEVYSFGGAVYRRGISYALYRTPYWISNTSGLYPSGEGFQPTFEADINDLTFGVGVKGRQGKYMYDVSHMVGSNTVNYTVRNSLNTAMGSASPTTFYPGGYSFSNQVTNMDIARRLNDKAFLSLGTEFRTERFQARAGDEASYFGNGAQSFPGLQPQNAVDAMRYNFGMYAGVDYDVTDALLVGITARLENYSDFGQNFSYKANGRYRINSNMSMRASYSTGFRAPSLHQIHMSNIQTLISGGTISNQGTFNNESSVVRLLGVSSLKPETAQNITAGFTAKFGDHIDLSADVYSVDVNDRIVYSSSIASSDTNTTVGQILAANQITSLKFFVNAVNTNTQGIDLVGTYSNLAIGNGSLDINLAANLNRTVIVGNISTPAAIAAAGVDLYDRKEQGRILSSRPQTKFIAGLDYSMSKWTMNLTNSYFGSVTWQHGSDPSKDQTFAAKWITDLTFSYAMSEKCRLTFGINNLLDVYPDTIDPMGDPVTDLGGRFLYPWEVNQFGFNGRIFSASCRFQL